MRYLSVPFLCFLFLACEGNTGDRRAARGEDFVSDPSHLYFLNIRSKDYRSVTLEQGVDAFYHDELPDPEPLVIIDRWLEDRAELQRAEMVLSLDQVQALRDSLRLADRSAELEVVEDYLRMIE